MTSLGPADIQTYSDDQLAKLYPSHLKLLLVQAIFRHGERAPVRIRLTNAGIPSHFDLCDHVGRFNAAVRASVRESAWSSLKYTRQVEEMGEDGRARKAGRGNHTCLLGELTDKGRLTTLTLGQRLRELYVTRLGYGQNIKNPDEVYLRSSPMPRALESLQQVYTGLLPPEALPSANFVPIIRQRNFTEENLYPNEGMCKKLRLLSEEYSGRAARKWNPILAGKTTDILGQYVPGPIKVDGNPRLSGLMDSINSSRGNDLPISPELLDPEMLTTMHNAVVEEWFGGYLANTTYRRLGAGRLLGDLKDQIVKATKHDPVKFALYGCHDTTIGALLSSIGAFDNKWPPFTSHIAIETFEKQQSRLASLFGSKQYFVRIRYNDKIVSIDGCQDPEMCSLQEFTAMVDKLVPDNWQEECAV